MEDDLALALRLSEEQEQTRMSEVCNAEGWGEFKSVGEEYQV